MSIAGKIKFYDVKKCGYFKRGERTPEFGDFSELTKDFKRWITTDADRIHATKSFSAQDHNDEGELPAYCLSFQRSKATGDCLLVLWNEIESTDGKVASLDPNSRINDAPQNSIKTTKTPGSNIPGYATYFWLIPERNQFAAIRFQHNYFRVPRFRTFIQQFAATRSQFVSKTKTPEGFRIDGFRRNSTEEPKRLNPYFETSPTQIKGKIEALRERVGDIRKIIRVIELEPDNPIHFELVNWFLNSIGLQEAKNNWEGRRYDASFNIEEMSSEEFEKLLQDWKNGDTHGRIGFKLKGDDETYWLDHAEVKKDVDFHINRANVEIVELAELFQELQARRSQLLEPRERDD